MTSAPPDVALSVAEAAARIGVTAATLRTWDRRYGLAPSIRTAGGHRRYSGADLDRLRGVARLIESGHPAAEAAAACPASGQVTTPLRSARPGGGRVIPLPDGTDVQRGLARAATALDGAAITRILAVAIDRHGVVATWNDVIAPVLVSVGERWARTGQGVEIEHVLANGVTGALMGAMPEQVPGPRPVLLACMPHEEHVLPLLALHAALLAEGTPSVLLGHKVPPEAIVDAVRRIRPRKLALWAQTPGLADAGIVSALPSLRPPLSPVLLGPGWDGRCCPDVPHPGTLSEALSELAIAS
jgi:DNA-binding transcriptional MerR regulator